MEADGSVRRAVGVTRTGCLKNVLYNIAVSCLLAAVILVPHAIAAYYEIKEGDRILD